MSNSVKMAYAGDKFYNDVIRRQMGDLATKVKVREIIPHLYCLTLSDQEEIEAKRETVGNYSAMMVLLDNLRRRENWPDLFVKALRKCEHWALADELGEAYDRIRGIHTQREDTAAASAPPPPPPPPAAAAAAASVSHAEPSALAPAAPSPATAPAEALATVTKVTIHNVPHATTPLLTPSASALSATPSINSPLGPSTNIAASASVEVPALVSAPDGPVHPPSDLIHPAEPPVSVVSPDPKPPSLVSAFTLTPSTGQREVLVDSSETPRLGTSVASAPTNSESGSNIVSPCLTEAPALDSAIGASVQASQNVDRMLVSAPQVTTSVGQSKIPVSSRVTSPQAISGGQTNTSLSGPSSGVAPTLATNLTSTSSQTNKAATTSQASASPEESRVLATVEENSGSVKHPIQDTNTPGIVLSQDLQNNPANSQVVKRVHTAVSPICQTPETSQGAAHASSSASTGAIAGCVSNFAAENEEYFSKPGVIGEEEPYSVGSDCLQISHPTMERSPIRAPRLPAVFSPHVAEEHVNESDSITTDDLMLSSSTTVPAQCVSSRTLKNSTTESDNYSHPNQPVEDFYESDIRVHIGEVSENPSIQNLNGLPPSMIGQTTIGESESLVQSVSENQPSQCVQGNITSEQSIPAAGLKPYAATAPATFQKSELNVSGQINIPQSEQRENHQGMLNQFKSNAYLIAAAAIGMTAIFVAWKYK